MAEPKTQPTDQSIEEFLASLPDERVRQDCARLVELMQAATGEPPVMWGSSIVGFGSRPYKYASGKTLQWPVIGFAPRKNDLTLYIMNGFEGYDEFLGVLGKHKTAKSCLYIKKLADVDEATLEKLIQSSVAAVRKYVAEM